MLWIFWRGFSRASKQSVRSVHDWWGSLHDWWSYLTEEWRNRDFTEWDLVTAIPARRSLTPRTISRQLHGKKGKR